MNLKLTGIKQKSIWVFDHEHQDTIAEPLCNGTELVMDQYFEIDMNRYPKEEDKLEIVVDTESFDDYDTELKLISSDQSGSIYLDTQLYEEVWLCPWLQSYFGEVPKKLYVKLDAVNPGKVAFEKTIKTGVNSLSKYLDHFSEKKEKMSDDEFDKILEGITEKELTDYINSTTNNGGRL